MDGQRATSLRIRPLDSEEVQVGYPAAESGRPDVTSEIVFNLHLLERCNYRCTHCFAHWDSSGAVELLARPHEGARVIRSLADAARAIRFDGRAADVRFNFVGGEPGLVSSLTELVDAARTAGARTSIVTNGLLFKRYSRQFVAEGFDIVGVSIDSVRRSTMLRIGRSTSAGHTLDVSFFADAVRALRVLRPAIVVKLNTVVGIENCDEDLSNLVDELRPERWKVMQVLPIYTSDVLEASRFHAFVERHRRFRTLMVVEDNDQMTDSYLMVDPTGRFFWRSTAAATGYDYSSPILEAGAAQAMGQVPIDWAKYFARY
jgi:radical S-adenosyl methionine domain-containing protein 2